MKWPKAIDDNHVLVGLNIEHPAFGVLYVDRIQRTREEIEALVAEDKDKDVRRPMFKYNSDFYTITKIIYFKKEMFEEKGYTYFVQEHYLIYLDWTGY